MDKLTFRDPDAPYIPTREEYDNYLAKIRVKNFKTELIHADIRHDKAFFNKGFNNIKEVFPYAKEVMQQLGYSGEIVDKQIVWTHERNN